MNKSIRTQEPGPIFFLITIVLGIGIFKEWLSDYKRKTADKQTNQTVHWRVVSVSKDDEEDKG